LDVVAQRFGREASSKPPTAIYHARTRVKVH